MLHFVPVDVVFHPPGVWYLMMLQPWSHIYWSTTASLDPHYWTLTVKE